MTYSEEFSRFGAGVRFGDLPASAAEAAKRHLLDIIGVGLIGSRQEMAQRSLEGVSTIPGSQGKCRVWGREETLALPYAAMVNGVASHVLDFDDTHTDSITHGSAILGPSVLALGQTRNSSGADVIAAFVVGWEVIARVGLASRGTFHKRGFHTTSIAGIFGATAAAAKLLGLTQTETSHALGLAGSQVSGVSEYLSNGSSSKSFHPGWAAYSGIVAAHLARAGMTGPMTVFEGRYGLFKTYGIVDECDVGALTSELGERWEVGRISIKPYPCCHFAHAFIDCAAALRRRGIKADEVEHLQCVVPEIELPLICEPFAGKLRPESPYAARFSLPFLVAAALIDGIVDHETFTPAHIQRADLLGFAQRVGYRVAATGETTFPTYFPGWITATLKNGRSTEERLDINYGNPDNPMDRSDIETKFRRNAKGILREESVASLLSKLQELERVQIADLVPHLEISAFTPAERSHVRRGAMLPS